MERQDSISPPHIRPTIPISESRRSMFVEAPNSTHSSRFWRWGSVKISKEMLQYIVQMSMLTTTMIFSLVNLATSVTNQTLYISLLSTIIGVVIPNPKIVDK